MKPMRMKDLRAVLAEKKELLPDTAFVAMAIDPEGNDWALVKKAVKGQWEGEKRIFLYLEPMHRTSETDPIAEIKAITIGALKKVMKGIPSRSEVVLANEHGQQELGSFTTGEYWQGEIIDKDLSPEDRKIYSRVDLPNFYKNAVSCLGLYPHSHFGDDF